MPSLSDDAARLAALNFAIVDAKLANSIIGLTADKYNNLLVIAGQLYAENGNHMLTTALNAIRGSKIILDQVSEG